MILWSEAIELMLLTKQGARQTQTQTQTQTQAQAQSQAPTHGWPVGNRPSQQAEPYSHWPVDHDQTLHEREMADKSVLQ